MLVKAAQEPKALLESYRVQFEDALKAFNDNQKDHPLYEPIKYILSLGGKRLRPTLVLAACDGLGGDVKAAIPVAMAVEVFHNFTLMHDDIMDDAPLRRGKPTVHEKWDDNTAILSGDAMLVQCYDLLAEVAPSKLPELMRIFNKTALEVCEGQQHDMDFETRDDVEIEEYMEMIRLKTSVLLAGAMEMGAIVAGADQATRDSIYRFGIDTGLAFQLQDDYLDAFGDPISFGKQVGGDILADKKTFLRIRTKENATSEQLAVLENWKGSTDQPEAKVEAIKALFQDTRAASDLREELKKHHDQAVSSLTDLPLSEEVSALFSFIAEMVTIRTV